MLTFEVAMQCLLYREAENCNFPSDVSFDMTKKELPLQIEMTV